MDKSILYLWVNQYMRWSRKFFQSGSNFFLFFFFSFSWLGERGYKYHYKRAIIGPPAKRHLNGVSLAGRLWPNTECWLVSFVVLQGIQTNIAKKPYIVVIFRDGGPYPLPPLDPTLFSMLSKLSEHHHEKMCLQGLRSGPDVLKLFSC